MPIGSLQTWQEVARPEHAALRAAAAEIETIAPASVAALRRRWSADLVAVALELGRARRRAAARFTRAAQLLADVTGVEQASSETVARHKAARFADLGPARIVDLCCGIGGDAMSLAEVADTLVVDSDPVRAWMAATNAGAASLTADVTALPLERGVVHIDPDRRPVAGRRALRYEDYCPGPPFIAELVAAHSATAVKLGPGVDLDVLPDPDTCEVELISEDGRLVQAVLWGGDLARHPGQRSATRLPDRVTVHGVPAPLPGRAGPEFDGVLLVPDPALERAGLVGTVADPLGLVAPQPGPGLLTAAADPGSPWFAAFSVTAQMPWRPATVQRWLADHDAGPVEVKTRGGAVRTDDAQRRLRGSGEEPFTVFVLRMGTAVRAVITRRLSAATP